jgi:CheY-like chemotaxis protein/anti-sigma regulatory factor (Ser/Thr protein kinase)
MKVEASAKGLALTAAIADDVPDLVLGDAARVRQILFNLVANAIKFTPAGSVGIALRRVQDASAGVVLEFEVRDTGIGIDAADLARLFTAFAQADGSTTRPFGGIGLGLAISQELARQMHGGLHIDSVVGEGTCARCTLWFDACEPRAQAGAAPAAVEGAATGPSVLLVEDNPVNLEVGIAMLEQLGCRITVAHDGAEALTHWRGACHDLVLMDCQMPVMDGFAATREMRAEEGGLGRLRTPIVALTANVFREDRDACFAAGMDDFLAKPYTLAQLREVIERHRHQARAA